MIHNHKLVVRSDTLKKEKIALQKEDVAFFKQCPKFRTREKEFTAKTAITFLNLRAHDCPRNDASVFSQRVVCKWDSTLRKDGPSSCRVLRPSPIRKATLMGWQNVEDIPYSVPVEYQGDLNRICLEDSTDRKIAKDFSKNEAKLKGDFKSKIQILSEFYQQLNEKYNFDFKQLGPENLRKQLEHLNQNYRDTREKPLRYVKYRGVKFMHILDDLPPPDRGSQSPSPLKLRQQQPTAIEELQAFEKISKVKRYQLRYKEKFADDLFYHLKPKQRKESKGSFQRIVDHSKSFIKLAQSRSANDLLMKHQGGSQPDIMTQSRFPGRDDLVQDFNQGVYLFKVKQVINENLSSFKQRKMNFMRRIDEVSPRSPDLEFDSQKELDSPDRVSIQPMSMRRLEEKEPQEIDRELHFQRLMKRFIKKQIFKISQPQSSGNVKTENLQQLIQQNLERKHHEESKLRKGLIVKSKLSQDLLKGRKIFTTESTSNQNNTTDTKTSPRLTRRVLCQEIASFC